MRKSCKTKKEKVPKLTEAQYTAYINALKGENGDERQVSGVATACTGGNRKQWTEENGR